MKFCKSLKSNALEKAINKRLKKLNKIVNRNLKRGCLKEIVIEGFNDLRACDEDESDKVISELLDEQGKYLKEFNELYRLVITRYNQFLKENHLPYNITTNIDVHAYNVTRSLNNSYYGVRVIMSYCININLIKGDSEKSKSEER